MYTIHRHIKVPDSSHVLQAVSPRASSLSHLPTTEISQYVSMMTACHGRTAMIPNPHPSENNNNIQQPTTNDQQPTTNININIAGSSDQRTLPSHRCPVAKPSRCGKASVDWQRSLWQRSCHRSHLFCWPGRCRMEEPWKPTKIKVGSMDSPSYFKF